MKIHPKPTWKLNRIWPKLIPTSTLHEKHKILEKNRDWRTKNPTSNLYLMVWFVKKEKKRKEQEVVREAMTQMCKKTNFLYLFMLGTNIKFSNVKAFHVIWIKLGFKLRKTIFIPYLNPIFWLRVLREPEQEKNSYPFRLFLVDSGEIAIPRF